LQASGHHHLAKVAQAHQQNDDPDGRLDQFLRAIDPTRAPRLASNVAELDFGTLPQRRRRALVLEVSNDGKGLLDVRVGRAPAGGWLSLNPVAFRCFPGQKQQIEVTIDTTRLTRKQVHQTRLTIDSNGGTLSIPVTVTIPAKAPTPMIKPTQLNFGLVGVRSEIAAQVLNITNAGDGSLAGTITADQDWIQATPESFSSISGDVVEQIQVSVDAKRLKSRASYSGRVVVAYSGAEMGVTVYMRTLPTRWQMFTARVRTTIQYAAPGLLVGLLASLAAWVWGKGLTLFLQEEGVGDILRDIIVASAFVGALAMSGLAVRARSSVVIGCLIGAILGAASAIAIILIGWVTGQLYPTEFIAGGALFGLLVGAARGLTRKL